MQKRKRRKVKEGECYITEHAYQRLRERNGWNKKTSDRMVQKIYALRKMEETSKNENIPKLLDGADSKESYVVPYGDILYIFNNDSLITILWQHHMNNIANKVQNPKRKQARTGEV